MYDVAKNLDTKPDLVATGFSRPDQDDAIQQLEERGDFAYLEGAFGKISDEDLGEDFDLVTDNNGVLLYTETLSEDLQRMLEVMKVGASLFISNVGTLRIDAPKDDNELHTNIRKWLDSIAGAKLEAVRGTYQILLEKVDEDVDVPALKLERDASDWSAQPPERSYTT